MFNLFHIGKSGGSSFKRFLTKNKVKFRHIHVHNSSKISQNYLQENTKLVITLRDPIKRCMSIFYFWLRHISSNNNLWKFSKSYCKYYTQFKTFNSLVSSLVSDDLKIKNLAIDYFKNVQHIKQNLQYYLGSKKLLEKNKNKILFIIEQENYNHDFLIFNEYLNKKYSVPIDLEYSEKTKQVYDKQKQNQLELYNISKQNEEILRKFLESEYIIYDYLKSNKKEINSKIMDL